MRYALPLLVVGLLIAVCPASAQELSEADARLLEDVLKSTLYDPPSGARRCRFKMRVRTVWGQETLVEREGWAIVGKDGKTKIMLADGWKVQGAQDVKPFDFRKGNSALLLALENPNRQPPPEASREHPLALAAWVYRTGDKGLASIFMGMALQEFQALKSRAPKGQAAEFKLPSVLRGHLTWQAYSALVHAYMIRADAEAERWGKHLQRRYAAEIKGTQVDQIMGDLARRKAAGTAGKTPTRKSMALLAAMAPAARIPALIAVLDEVDARQRTQPGGVDLASDPRVAALIDCKDLAVPALLDVLAKDQRLTRSVHFWRDFSQDRTVLSVAEVALVALQSILRVRVFKPSSTGDNFTVRGPKAARLAAEKLRGYWRANRAMSLSERLRRALTREQSAPEDWRRAATEIARLGQERRIGTTLGADQVSDTRGENPALELKDPTAAVAILAAMDRDLTQHKSSAKYRDLAGGELRELEALYMDALVRLGDKRIAPVLAKRAATETIPSMRRLLAVTCRGLGEGGPLNDLAVAFARGKHTVGAFSAPETPLELTPGAIELDACVQTFTQLAAGGVASCDSALFALASPKHPLRNLALELIWSKAGPEGGLWVQHSWHLRLLASALTQTQETGRIYRLEEVAASRRQPRHWEVVVEEQGKEIARQVLSAGAPPAQRRKRVAERQCDRAATALSVRLLGTPTYDLLLKNCEARRADLIKFCERFLPGVRRATPLEVAVLRLGDNPFGVFFLPGLGLSRAATEADVAAGRALFTLSGGQPIQVVLPAAARFKQTRQRALVLQGEAGQGQARFAVLTADALVVVGPEAISEPRPIPNPAEQTVAANTLLSLIAANKDAQAAALLAEDFRQTLATEKSTKIFFDQIREAIRKTPRARLVQGLAPGFAVQADGILRWEAP